MMKGFIDVAFPIVCFLWGIVLAFQVMKDDYQEGYQQGYQGGTYKQPRISN